MPPPSTATTSPSRGGALFTARTATSVGSIRAPSASESESGSRTQANAGTVTNSASPPSVWRPMAAQFSQSAYWCCRQNTHALQKSTMSGATRSPSRRPSTPGPSAVDHAGELVAHRQRRPAAGERRAAGRPG